MDGREETETGIFWMHRVPALTSLQQKKTKGKIARCSGMSKFCPPAAALRESIRGNQYRRMRSRANGGWGGVIDKIGRESHLSRCPSPSRFGASF
jgi:hypothetical protein